MTLGEGKREVLMLIDEYSSGGQLTVDEDIDLKMNDFFDLAQTLVAQIKPVVKHLTVEDGIGRMEIPHGFQKLLHVWSGERDVKKRCSIRAGFLYCPPGTVTVSYVSDPQKITPETPDSYEFEVCETAAACMPYYVAAQQLVVDLVIDYGALLNLYNMMVAGLTPGIPGEEANGGFGSVRQTLYR